MPVTAPPALEANPPGLLRCEPNRHFEDVLLARRQSAAVAGGSSVTWELDLKSGALPLDLSLFGLIDGAAPDGDVGTAMRARFREAVTQPEWDDCAVLVVAADSGRVRVTVPDAVLDRPGVYGCDVAVLENGRPKVTDSFWLWVDPSGWDQDGGRSGPPPLDSVRASLADDDLVRNILTEHQAYPLTDLCEGAVRATRFWNETGPPVAYFDTRDFGYRGIWTAGIQLFAFQSAEEWYRRNRQPHSAGGTTVDDNDREQQYKAAWQERYQEFRRDVLAAKVRINVSGGSGSFGSGYHW